ncbi:MAG TPA: TetR/AcrR family transcriptional regulator [Acidobacteriaceae bacterium]|nr:TetR/AcrR family transcriptional regulator [Acidobacteriaceae bacterium]
MSSTAQIRNPTRKQVLTDLRREEILTAAIKVFGKKGFAATCVGDVADAAKMAKGTVYLYFESKEEIYATAIRLAIERLQALAEERTRAATGVRERLAVAISLRMEFWHEQLNLYRLLLTVGREPQHKRQTHELLRTGHAHFVGILKEGVEAGEIARNVDLDTVAWAILDMVRGANERRMDNLTERTPQEDAAAITAFALSQLGLA